MSEEKKVPDKLFLRKVDVDDIVECGPGCEADVHTIFSPQSHFITHTYTFVPESSLAAAREEGRKEAPLEDEVKWIVNNNSELGVEIRGRCYFLYKGRSYGGGDKYREVYKREFGECCHPWGMIEYRKYGDIKQNPARPIQLPENYIGFMGEEESEWKEVVPAVDSAAASRAGGGK